MLKTVFRRLLFASSCLTILVGAVALAQDRGTDASTRLDSILAAAFGPEAPGAAVIIVQEGRTVLRKGYGLANLETKTPMRPDMVLQIGSVTKQFTSTAILMLLEQGKLSLDDEIWQYFPDYPSRGAKITIEHLLTHTSGIKSYTNDSKWPTLWREDLTPQQVIDLTKDSPLEFAPGSKWNYNNTGYTMLGAIIEKVSGQSYAEFVRRYILEPAGMSRTLYGSLTQIIPNRAAGYTRGTQGWENAPYLSMTQPYSAGALMSTVDDLALWDAAVSSGKLVSDTLWQRAFAGFKLASGEHTYYGYGWQLDEYQGRKVIHHGGGIPGYASESLRMPQERVYVAILANSDDPPTDLDFLATILAAEVIGQPYREPTRIKLPDAVLEGYVGLYRIDENSIRTITREGGRLFMQRTGAPKYEIHASAEGEFFRPKSFQRLSFVKDASGKYVELVSRTGNHREVAHRVTAPVRRP